MINLKATASKLSYISSEETYTSGMVGATVHIEFSDEWTNLTKTAVFTTGIMTRDVVESSWVDNVITVPHELLENDGNTISIGLYGVNASGTIVIPTVYYTLGKVYAGASPSGDESTDSDLPVWSQIQLVADEAKTAANTAVNTANGAVTTANQAKTEADEALSVANDTSNRATQAAVAAELSATQAANSANESAANKNAAATSANQAQVSEVNATKAANTAADTVNGFDTHAADKTTAFDTNAANKTAAFDTDVNAAKSSIEASESAAKTYADNAQAAQTDAVQKANAANVSATNAANSAADAATNATNAANSAAEIENLTVSAETLSPDKQASVEKTVVNNAYNLKFGIPKGASGVYVGTTEPTDSNTNVWINPDGVADPVVRYDEQTLTDAQKETARTNIGAAKDEGNYELIETITLTSAVSKIERTKEPDGTSYNFKNICVLVNLPANTASAQATFYVLNASNNTIGFAYGNAIKTTATIGEFISECHNKRRFSQTEQTWNANTMSNSVANYSSYFGDDNIACWTFSSASSSVYIPAGTVISIYAMR